MLRINVTPGGLSTKLGTLWDYEERALRLSSCDSLANEMATAGNRWGTRAESCSVSTQETMRQVLGTRHCTLLYYLTHTQLLQGTSLP